MAKFWQGLQYTKKYNEKLVLTGASDKLSK